ncbi:MAG TPA: Uma2 family endonuclease [Chloroflexia bacterium]|nr:Uma2 family endonuclease [Chloroflexia bacterium]
MNHSPDATIQDLLNYPEHGRAELVCGKIVMIPPMTIRAGRAVMNILLSLKEYEKQAKFGYALPSKVGYLVDLPHRKSFCPDCSFYRGPLTPGLPVGAPLFAVEMWDIGDCSCCMEDEFAAKRRDYFATGTEVLWDVDIRREDVVRVYRKSTPDEPTIYRRREMAEAEPALPGWRMPVDKLFRIK